MNKLLFYILLGLILSVSNLQAYDVNLSEQEQAWLQKHPVLRIGVLQEAYPYEFLDENNKYYGLSSDYASLWEKSLGVQFEVVSFKDWNEAAELFRQKKIDVFPLMVKKDIYDLGLIFSDTYMSSSLGIFSFGNATFINNLDDVVDEKIAITRETIDHTNILNKKLSNLVIFDDALKALEATNRGDTDFYIGDILNAKYMIDKKRLSRLHYVAPVVGSAFNFGLATGSDNKELISAVNKTLAKVTPLAHSNIRQKWTRRNFSQQELVQRFVNYIVGLLFLFMVALVYLMYRNQKMRKQALRLSQMQKMESIGILAGGIAHDFNNMLSGILGASESLAMRLEAQSPLLKYTNIIEQASERLASLTSELLVFAREKDKEHVIVDLHDLIGKAIRLLESGLHKQHCINLDFRAQNNHVLGNQDLIESMILNLAVNARDAMSKDGCIGISTCEVELDANNQEDFVLPFKSGKYIQLEVSDNGGGISPEIAARIFEPFFTTKEVGKGTGLGLAAVYGIVRDHAGTLRFTSSNEGTSFFIYLPLEDKPISNKVIIKNDGKIRAKILVVDDEKILLELLKDILTAQGAEVLTCNNALQAEDLYAENQDIDVVMLDVIMPNKNGVDIYESLRKVNPNLKMVLMSGYSKDAKIEQIIKNDKNVVFMSKPYRIDTCKELLQTLLDKKLD